jgi:hypothetical protein
MSARSNALMGAACVAGICLMYSVPYFITRNSTSLQNKPSALTGSQRQRGLYLNAGSQDVGIDPDWDPVTRKWKGFERRKKNAANKEDKKVGDAE